MTHLSNSVKVQKYFYYKLIKVHESKSVLNHVLILYDYFKINNINFNNKMLISFLFFIISIMIIKI